MARFDSRFAQERERHVAERVIALINHFNEPRIDNHLRALQTRRERRVDRSALERDAMVGRLGDRVFLCMRTEAFVEPCTARREIVTSRAAAFVAVFESERCSVIAC